MNDSKPALRQRLLAIAFATLLPIAGAFAQELPPMPPAPVIPPAPHQATPDAALLPDYYALALSHTKAVDDPAWRPLHLAWPAGRPDPAFIVLPVQTQAFAFEPGSRALVGGRLDQELQRRHVDASRQTDILDWRGPFVRRTDDATVAALAAEHPHSTLLALYLGHDAQGHAFVTLARMAGTRTQLAHRRIDFARGVDPTATLIPQLLPALLAEVGLGDAKPAPALPVAAGAGCDPHDWLLSEVDADASPAATACHGLLMGSLLPDYRAALWQSGAPVLPDRFAWLARAWVEASAMADASPAMRSVAALASFELGLDPTQRDTSALADDPDPVVRPLARMFWADRRAARAPARSRNDAMDHYAETVVDGLPPFAAAVVLEQVSFNASFRAVDLCDMELGLPWFKLPAGCEAPEPGTPRPTTPATRGQRQLLDAWRVAAAWKSLYIEGHMRGSAAGLADAERAIPAAVANHPLVRELRFAVRDTPVAPADIETYLVRSRQQSQDQLQVMATLQQSSALDLAEVASHRGMLPAESSDPVLSRVLDDRMRLDAVEFAGSLMSPGDAPRPPVPPEAAFLADGNFLAAQAAVMRAHWPPGLPRLAPPVAGASAASSPRAAMPRAPRPSFAHLALRLKSRSELEALIKEIPTDMDSRAQLAVVMLEHGEATAAVRRVLDARPRRTRVEDAIGETNDLVTTGNVFLFAGDTATARPYFRDAAALDTGSGSDLDAKHRMAAMAGDIRASLAVAQSGVSRYRDEWMLGKAAGDEFMLGRSDAAWQLLLPRLQTSRQSSLWIAALAGHRRASTPLSALPGWMLDNHLELATADGSAPAGASWLRAYATLDRLPTPADIAVLQAGAYLGPYRRPASGGLVIRAAIVGLPADQLEALTQDMATTYGSDRALFMPFYSWALWNASLGHDAALAEVRALPLEDGFPGVLAKAMVLAADGQHDEALRFLRAARYELARQDSPNFPNELLTAPYDFVLASWLMTRQTGERHYAEEGLALARGYQATNEYMAWPHAAEALLGHDPKARQLAACRAALLDPGSMFLHESGLHPDPKSATCRKATAW